MLLALALIALASPDKRVTLTINQATPQITWAAALGGRAVVEPSQVVMTVDGVNIAEGAKPGKPTRSIEEKCAAARIPFSGRIVFTLELRACNDGVAFRHIIPGSGSRIPDEATQFRLPAGATVWYHDLEGHYEALHVRKNVAGIPKDQWAAPPLTYQLPDDAGYASITEAALYRYAGMALQFDGKAFVARLGHTHPPSYPFRLRYKDDVERLKAPAAVDGPITTPWRVVMIGKDLNALVNSRIMHALAPRPERKLFPDGAATAWVKPGRAVWKYLDGGQNDQATVREFSTLAGQLGFEYQVIEGFWQKWPKPELKAIVEESRKSGVGLILWKHSNQLRTPEARKEFFDLLKEVGAAGAKIDFFDHEAKEIVELYETLLREAAERQLVVNFHGANKPTGEFITWPNELTREGVRGMESRKSERARHDATLPFTRYLAGPADYTPVHFGERRNDTTWTHQLASAVLLGSPLLTYAAHPKTLLDNPAVELIKSIPATWDETRVLPGSSIGEVAAIAKRKGATWFVAVLNGSETRRLPLDLSFLPAGTHEALTAREKSGESTAVDVAREKWSRASKMTLELPAGGGFLARLVTR